MSDTKKEYSDSSSSLRETPQSKSTSRMYERSRKKRDKHIDEWREHPVNINEVVDRYAPGAKGEIAGIKSLYRGKSHIVIADMASGSLRVLDTSSNKYISHSGRLSTLDKDTHFYILKREEM